jgi:Fur family peroxide stress response transcriptional regulator
MEIITREGLIGRLRERGLRITPQREAIVDALVENRHLHPAAGLIHREAAKRARRVSLSTVYATLGVFCQQGLLKNMEFDRMENRYEGNLQEHINLVCRTCGSITDYHIPTSIRPADIAREADFLVTETRMDYYGYCRDCLIRRAEATAGNRDGGSAI